MAVVIPRLSLFYSYFSILYMYFDIVLFAYMHMRAEEEKKKRRYFSRLSNIVKKKELPLLFSSKRILFSGSIPSNKEKRDRIF
jgi:hypothetical protein